MTEETFIRHARHKSKPPNSVRAVPYVCELYNRLLADLSDPQDFIALYRTFSYLPEPVFSKDNRVRLKKLAGIGGKETVKWKEQGTEEVWRLISRAASRLYREVIPSGTQNT